MQINCDSAEAGMVVVVRVSKVEMYSDVNLHLKRLNTVTHMGWGWLEFLMNTDLKCLLGKNER